VGPGPSFIPGEGVLSEEGRQAPSQAGGLLGLSIPSMAPPTFAAANPLLGDSRRAFEWGRFPVLRSWMCRPSGNGSLAMRAPGGFGANGKRLLPHSTECARSRCASLCSRSIASCRAAGSPLPGKDSPAGCGQPQSGSAWPWGRRCSSGGPPEDLGSGGRLRWGSPSWPALCVALQNSPEALEAGGQPRLTVIPVLAAKRSSHPGCVHALGEALLSRLPGWLGAVQRRLGCLCAYIFGLRPGARGEVPQNEQEKKGVIANDAVGSKR